MVFIHGRKSIERELRRRLGIARSGLLKKASGRESKYLFVTLHAMNYQFGPRLVTSSVGESLVYYDMSVFRVLVSLKDILDILLERTHGVVDVVGPQDYVRITNDLQNHFAISSYSQALQRQAAHPREKARIEKDVIDDLAGDDYHEAITQYVNSASSDEGWQSWYWKKGFRNREKVARILESEFRKSFGLDYRDAANLSEYLVEVTKRHLDNIKSLDTRTHYPMLEIEREKFRQQIRMILKDNDASRWFGELEYHPGKDINRSPLIPLSVGGKDIYTIAQWVVYPSHQFWGAWLNEMFARFTRSKAFGEWSRGYGGEFERYLDHLLDSRLSGASVRKNLKRSARDYPEIIPILARIDRRGGFELDRLVLMEDTAYAVSCKATDFFYDQKLTSRNLFFSLEEIENRVQQNVRQMVEAQTIAECIEASPNLKKSMGLTKETLVPIVVVSRIQPLSVRRTREFYQNRQCIPNVQIVTALQLIESLRTERSH